MFFARLDGDKEKALVAKYGVGELPAILAFKKGHKKHFVFDGDHSAAALMSYAHKVIGPPVTKLGTEAAVLEMIAAHNKSTVVVGFFRSDASDEYEDWAEATRALSLRRDVWAGQVVDPDGALLATFTTKPYHWFDAKRSSTAVVFRREEDRGAGRDLHALEERVKVELETLTLLSLS